MAANQEVNDSSSDPDSVSLLLLQYEYTQKSLEVDLHQWSLQDQSLVSKIEQLIDKIEKPVNYEVLTKLILFKGDIGVLQCLQRSHAKIPKFESKDELLTFFKYFGLSSEQMKEILFKSLKNLSGICNFLSSNNNETKKCHQELPILQSTCELSKLSSIIENNILYKKFDDNEDQSHPNSQIEEEETPSKRKKKDIERRSSSIYVPAKSLPQPPTASYPNLNNNARQLESSPNLVESRSLAHHPGQNPIKSEPVASRSFKNSLRDTFEEPHPKRPSFFNPRRNNDPGLTEEESILTNRTFPVVRPPSSPPEANLPPLPKDDIFKVRKEIDLDTVKPAQTTDNKSKSHVKDEEDSSLYRFTIADNYGNKSTYINTSKDSQFAKTFKSFLRMYHKGCDLEATFMFGDKSARFRDSPATLGFKSIGDNFLNVEVRKWFLVEIRSGKNLFDFKATYTVYDDLPLKTTFFLYTDSYRLKFDVRGKFNFKFKLNDQEINLDSTCKEIGFKRKDVIIAEEMKRNE
ncbi:Translation initiation factor IF-2 [Wickerhamomyces ciferrii]|uniref:Translation initiation factor IF-2 n=1 Tax=Wickerhamomyces ciferrii (strain ATCC 14091 / BCRC 22168 / CBS 111 / JCM 3599 / NBRC 0793 / NRRL Y-1031 F-60-10) TaxID=1206466 RepID=K0KNJ0_WICCF|nr:Translation initiation factor IF-2 [Wickerhamomyces ciferrii]CCH44561.1 Translation initiation factor IF-2 [Wickerhamomyces ciferrii]